MEHTRHMVNLLQRYLHDQLSSSEEDELKAWASQSPENAALLQQVRDQHGLLDGLSTWDKLWNNYANDREQRMTETILVGTGHRSGTRRRSLYRWLPYAAAVAVLLTIGWLVVGDRWSLSEAHDPVSTADIPPGGNRATLTLADGRTIDLSEAQTGIIVAEGITYLDGTQVMANGELKMKNERPGEENGILNAQFSILNAITTPKGGAYQITLPDGSKVWLNSASTLKYPSRFSEDAREVFLEGEAYFDIREQVDKRTVEQKIPFRVITSGQSVEVLGTGFNVSAYPDESETKTTLVEGAVRIRVAGTQRGAELIWGGKSLVLSPGEQGLSANGELVKSQVDVYAVTAWKSGFFHFKQTPFVEMMRQIERWYDVEVVFKREVPEESFSGRMRRDVSLLTVLDLLKVSEISFHIEGKKLIID